jgi:glycosyltransferase involved in cell wall biosynthesis
MYRAFHDSPHPEPGARPSVCIVSSEVVGPFNNGGIGTSMTGLAQCLAAAGFPVTLLYTGGKWSSDAERDHWRGLYRRIGIDLAWLVHGDAAHLTGPVADCGFVVPYLVYRHLREQRFDVVQFNDCMGEGFYCLAMKRLGAAFGETLLCVALHSPSQWVFELNRVLPDHLLHSAFSHAERLSTRSADLLWSPSRYLLDWCRSRGFVFPPATYVQQYAIPSSPLFEETAAAPARERVRPAEIVFFGRLEERKGIRLFCNALRRLNGLLSERGIAVTFLGKPGMVGEVHAADYLKEQARTWRFSWNMLGGLGQQEAVDYVRSRAALAVIASPADNSPCTVYEALAYGVPFLAARTGGIPELIDEADHASTLFDYSPESLAARLEQAIAFGIKPARPVHSQQALRRRWAGAFAGWRGLLPGDGTPREAPRRLCAVIDHQDGLDLGLTLASLTVPEVSRIVVVNRSPRPFPQGAAPPASVIELSLDDPGLLLEALPGTPDEALLLLRSGAALLAGAVPGLIAALAAPEGDGLVPAAMIGSGEACQIVPPLGASQSFCFFEGAAHTGGLVIKAERIRPLLRDEALAVDAEYLGLADLAVAGGLELLPYAEPAFRHPKRLPPDRRSRRAPERVAAYGRAAPTERYYIAAIACSRLPADPYAGSLLRALRERLYRMRLGWAVRLARRIVPRRLVAKTLGRGSGLG